jgi:hypothetical protein
MAQPFLKHFRLIQSTTYPFIISVSSNIYGLRYLAKYDKNSNKNNKDIL